MKEITDRQPSEEVLRQSEERFRRLVELMPVAVYVCDTSGTIQSYNRRAVELWGVEPAAGETAQRYCASLRLYSPDGRVVPHQESAMAVVLRTGVEVRDLEVVIERPDGSRITVSVNIESSSLLRDLPGDATQQSNRAESIVRLVDQTLQIVRRISTELRPGTLDLGLVAALEWAAEEFEDRTGTTCHLDLLQDDVVIDGERATAFFRILQETLTNVARHAHATRVDVRLAREEGSVILEVSDNGKGISGEELSARASLGILGMRERALLLGGALAISGAAGEGTTVRVRIPETRRSDGTV
jgi:PAS domain S-box-containing protein